MQESIFPLFDALTTELANVQLLKVVHAYAILVSYGFVSGEGKRKRRERKKGEKKDSREHLSPVRRVK
jgi:hypothetical protein